MQENKKYYLTIGNETIEVTEDVYRAYVRPIKAERQRKRREWKCKLLSKNGGHFLRCTQRCESCAYYMAGNNAQGNNLSLDKIAEDGVFIEDKSLELENNFIEKETNKEEYQKLYEAIKKLTKRQQEFVKLIYFKGKTREEVARLYEIDASSVRHALIRIKSALKSFLEK
mgnify:CR=1 FL=1